LKQQDGKALSRCQNNKHATEKRQPQKLVVATAGFAEILSAFEESAMRKTIMYSITSAMKAPIPSYMWQGRPTEGADENYTS